MHGIMTSERRGVMKSVNDSIISESDDETAAITTSKIFCVIIMRNEHSRAGYD